mgnify:CR=1 FL=1
MLLIINQDFELVQIRPVDMLFWQCSMLHSYLYKQLQFHLLIGDQGYEVKSKRSIDPICKSWGERERVLSASFFNTT